MQLSHYLKIYPFEERPGFVIVYSTKKGSVSILNEKTFHSIEDNSLQQKDKDILTKLGIIVPDKEAEKRDVRSVLDRLNEKNKTLNITVLLNLDCNFACTYCYEGELKGKLYMSDETKDHLIAFAKSRFRNHMKSLNIDFFGGEPLLSTGIIKSISEELKSFAESKEAAYTFTLTSNGSLLKREIAEELSDLGLTSVKITLDGPADLHNRCRPFRSGKGTFDIIMKNMKETCGVVKIAVGGNFTKVNYNQFPELLDSLKNEGLKPDKIAQVKFDPVMPVRSDAAPTDFVDACMSINEPWLIEASVYLREEILKHGYNTPKIIPTPCQVEINDYYVVNFNGLLYKCPAFIGKEGFEIGDLTSGVRDCPETYRAGFYKNAECLDCEYLPLCFGGCRYMAYARDGNLDTPDCKKPYLDACLETFIKQDVKYRNPAKTEKD